MYNEWTMITVLTGSNNFQVAAELKQRIARFVQVHGNFGLERLDGEEVAFERIAEALQSMSFLAEAKLVVLDNPSAVKQFQEKFEELLPTIPETTDVLIVETKLDKRTAYYKALKKRTDFKEYNELDAPGLVRWAIAYAAQEGGELTRSDASYLIERVGLNQQLLMQEVQKLTLYNPKITRETIDTLTDKMPQSTIFELLDAAFKGDHKRANSLYKEQRALKVEPQQILALMAWQLHALALVKVAGERSADEIAKTAKLNPFVVRKTQNLASQLTFAQVKSLVRRALELDIKLKTQSIDADEALQHLLLTLK